MFDDRRDIPSRMRWMSGRLGIFASPLLRNNKDNTYLQAWTLANSTKLNATGPLGNLPYICKI